MTCIIAGKSGTFICFHAGKAHAILGNRNRSPPLIHTKETTMSDPTAVMARPQDQERTVATLVAAFADDPFIRWMFPDARQ